MSLLSQKHLQDEEAAYEWVEAHIWPNGPVCPHCGGTERISRMQGKATRTGLYKCYACRKQFRVTVGTIFEKSHIPMHLWVQAFYLIAGSKKGISANQLHRTLGITLKSAWFVGHRIREAMRTGSLMVPMGGDGSPGIVEADETYHGPVENPSTTRADKETVAQIVNTNMDKEAKLVTDESRLYKGVQVAEHETVTHRKGEYVRGVVHTNTVEGYFSVFKRGMKGVYQHCAAE